MITREQIIELARSFGNFGQEGGSPFCFDVDETIGFANAVIDRYKSELIKGAGEPVAQADGTFNHACELGELLYTSDQLAAAVLAATGPLEDEIEELKKKLESAQKSSEEDADAAGYHAQWSREFKRQVDYLKNELAEAQEREEKLREAFQTFIDEHEECQDADDWMAMMCSIEAHHVADEALALPRDTTALERERQKVAAAVAAWIESIGHPGCDLIALNVRAGDWRKYLEGN